MKFKNEQWRDSGKTGHKTQNEDKEKCNAIQRKSNTGPIKKSEVEPSCRKGYALFISDKTLTMCNSKFVTFSNLFENSNLKSTL